MLDTAKNWLELARTERNPEIILTSLFNLENILYKQKLDFNDVGTSIDEIKRLKTKAYKKECCYYAILLKKTNNKEVLKRFEVFRRKSNLSYKETGISQLDFRIKKLKAKIF